MRKRSVVVYVGELATREAAMTVRSLREAYAIRFCSTPEGFCRSVREACCGIVVAPAASDRLLPQPCRAQPYPPPVLVAPGRGYTTSQFGEIATLAYRVLDQKDVYVSLVRAVDTAVIEHLLRRLPEAAARHPRLLGVEPFRRALVWALADPKCRSVGGIARSVGRSESYMHKMWRETLGRADSAPTLKIFLTGVLFLRAVLTRLNDPGRSWASIAADLGVTARTLRNHAHNVSGLPLSRSLDSSVLNGVIIRLEQEVFAGVFGTHASD